MNKKINDILSEYQGTEFKIATWFAIADKILENINIKDLATESTENSVFKLKYYRQKQLVDFSKSESLYLNKKYTEKVCKNVKSVTFNSLYPIILIKLIDNDILLLEDKKYYIVFKYLFNNRRYFKENKDNYLIVKYFINYFYGILVNYSKIKSNVFDVFDMYKFIIYEDIKNKLNDDLIYLDTDMFYYFGNYNWDFDIPYEIEDIEQFIIFRKKKYIKVKNGIIHSNGFSIV